MILLIVPLPSMFLLAIKSVVKITAAGRAADLFAAFSHFTLIDVRKLFGLLETLKFSRKL